MATALLVISELKNEGLARFWAEHPMSASVVAFVSTVGLAILVFEDLRERQDARTWENVSHLAFKKLSGIAFKVCGGTLQVTGFKEAAEHLADAIDHRRTTGERPGIEAPPLLPADYEEQLAELLEDPEYRSVVTETLMPVTHELDLAISQWAPVMLGSPKLAKSLETFSFMRDMHGWVVSAIECYADSERAKVDFWSNLRVYLWFYSAFDLERRNALGEENSLILGTDADQYDRAWGLPFKAQRWLWEPQQGAENGTTLAEATG